MRVNIVSLVLGTRGSGKTFFTKRAIRSANKANKKVLIIDTFDHPSYQSVPRIKPIDIKNIEAGEIVRVFGGETNKILSACNDFSNGLLIIEDATKYIEGKLSEDVKQFVLDSKQKNIDIIFLFHGFGAAPPALFRVCDKIILMRTGDNPTLRKNNLPNFEEVMEAYGRIKESKEKYPYEIINLY